MIAQPAEPAGQRRVARHQQTALPRCHDLARMEAHAPNPADGARHRAANPCANRAGRIFDQPDRRRALLQHRSHLDHRRSEPEQMDSDDRPGRRRQRSRHLRDTRR